MVYSLLLSFFINDIILHVNIRHLKYGYVFTFFPLLSCLQCSFLHIQIYLKYICSSNVHVRYEKMNIITGQTNSFSRWVHPTNAVSIVGNVNIRVQSSDPNFRPATSDPLNKGTSNGLSHVRILLREVKFVFWQMRLYWKLSKKIKVGNFTVFERVYINVFQFLSFKW